MTCALLMDTFSTTVPCVSLGRSSSFCTKFFVFLSWTHFQQLSRAYHWAGVCQEFFSSFCTKIFVLLIRTIIQQLSRVYHGAPPASSSFYTNFFCLSSKDKYLTTVPCVSRNTPCEGSMGRFYKRASRLLYHRVGDLSIGNLHKIFFIYFISLVY